MVTTTTPSPCLSGATEHRCCARFGIKQSISTSNKVLYNEQPTVSHCNIATPLIQRNTSSHRIPCRKSNTISTFNVVQVLMILILTVLADDSSPPFFVTPQSSPQTAPILITPTPISRPTTSSPIAQPISSSTRQPTLRPNSKSPTLRPTRATTIQPTPSPSELESDAPTMKATSSPTTSPIELPSSVPTISAKPTSLTNKPTISPKPTIVPTRAPVNKPTRKPSTNNPTLIPSSSPSLLPQRELVPVVMILSRTFGKLDGKAAIDFQSITETFLLKQLNALDLNEPVTFLQINVDIFSQLIDDANSNERVLADTSESSNSLVDLRVEYNTQIVYQSTNQDSNPIEWIGKAFNSDQKRELYIVQLQNANSDAFSNLQNIELLVDGMEPPDVTPIEDEDEESKSGVFQDQTLWIIIGAVGGSISLLVIITTIYYMGRNGRKKNEIETTLIYRRNKQNMTADTKQIKNQLSYDSDTSPTNKLAYTAEIDVDFQNDDVSTLGDPTCYGGMIDQQSVNVGSQKTNNDSLNAESRGRFLSEDDDDVLLFSESNLSKQNDDIVVRTILDNSEKSNRSKTDTAKDSVSKYAVEVPPGKLGMIIDTPDNGPPVVHTIKPESILCATVSAGDLLLSVDDENVTHMTAVQVSKLISMKSDQQRTLIFLRKHYRERFNSSSSDYIEQNGAC